MKWHDLLYFSKGERRALTLLASLIAAGWLTLLWMPQPAEEPSEAPARYHAGNTERYQPNRPDDENGQRTASSFPDSLPENTGTDASRRGRPKADRREATAPSTVASRVSPRPSTSRRAHPSHFPSARTKFPEGTVIELNAADTTILKKVPGIGSSFARRIVKYRNLLGGYYTVAQLSEVYGIDEDRYLALAPWFRADASLVCPIRINRLAADSLPYHPYLNKAQKRVLRQLRRQKGRIEGWENLQLLEEFAPADRERLGPYLSFE